MKKRQKLSLFSFKEKTYIVFSLTYHMQFHIWIDETLLHFNIAFHFEDKLSFFIHKLFKTFDYSQQLDRNILTCSCRNF